MKKRPSAAGLVAAALFFVALGACTKQEPQVSDPLRVYTYDSFGGDIVDALTAALDEQGIAVEFEQPGDSGAVYTRLFLERQDPRADVFIGLDQTYLGDLRENGLAEAYVSEDFEPAIPAIVLDQSGLTTPFDYGYITLNYDSAAVDNPPTSWAELADPRFANSIIMLNPATSSPGRNFLLLTVAELGEEGFLDYWRQLKPNVLTVAGGWTDGYGLYTQGEAALVVSYDTSPAYHRLFEETDRYKSLAIAGGGYLQVEVAGIVRGTDQREAAEALIDLLVSPAIQELIPLNQFMYPAQAGTTLPEGYELPDQRVSRPVILPQEEVAAKFSGWMSAWEEVMR